MTIQEFQTVCSQLEQEYTAKMAAAADLNAVGVWWFSWGAKAR